MDAELVEAVGGAAAATDWLEVAGLIGRADVCTVLRPMANPTAMSPTSNTTAAAPSNVLRGLRVVGTGETGPTAVVGAAE